MMATTIKTKINVASKILAFHFCGWCILWITGTPCISANLHSDITYRCEVHFTHDAPTKSKVTLRWRLQTDCRLQDSIITGYNISYCPIIDLTTECDKSIENKYVLISNPKLMDVTIENLYSFRTYLFNFALNTIYGQINIENAIVIVTTLEGIPTSPRNVLITNVTNNSLGISWDPPQNRNGNIGKYVIWNYDKVIYEDYVSGMDTSKRKITLTGLQAYSNYFLAVQACNIAIGLCSKIRRNDTIFVRSSIGPPSRLKAPTVKNNPAMLAWEYPENPGGTVDLFQIRRIKDDLTPEIINTKDSSYPLNYCESFVSKETYEVRAVNFDSDMHNGALGDTNVTLPRRASNDTYKGYPGEWSAPSIVVCRNEDGLNIILIFIGVIGFIGVAYGLVKLHKK